MQIPGYEIQHQLGKGGMATVYLAVQQSLHRQVALKIMSPSLAANEEFSHRFIKEGQIVGRLSHPNIVTVFDIGVQDSHHYLSMEYLPGGTLKERIQAGEISTERAIQVVRVVAEALGHAHQKGYIHRDIKPNNVLFRQDGTPVLTDFGVAKDLESTTQLTVTGITIGSINYMSPEQFRGGEIDTRSDLYGLGVLLWETLTGELPYRAGSNDPFAIALKHANDPVPSLPENLRRYQGLIDGLMAKQPEDRFKTAGDFIRVLDAVQQRGELESQESTEMIPGAARPAPPVKTTTGPVSSPSPAGGGSRRWLLGLAALVLLLGGTYAALALLDGTIPGLNSSTLAGLFSTDDRATVAPTANPAPTTEPVARTDPVVDPVPQPVVDTDPRPIPEIPPGTQDTVTDGTAVAVLETAPPPSSETEPSVDELLARAQALFRNGQYAPPAPENAMEIYNRILELEPGNQTARAGLLAIGQMSLGNRYQNLAREALDVGDLATGLAHIQKGLRLAPEHPGLLALRESVQAQREGADP